MTSVYPINPTTGRAALGGRVRRARRATFYLAGKIDKDDWRCRFVPGLRYAVNDHDLYESGYAALDQHIDVGDADYVGPFFVSCDHGCAHADDTHGVMGGCITSGNGAGPDTGRTFYHYMHHSGCDCDACSYPKFIDFDARSHVARKCFDQIAAADYVIALIADDAHGTLVEVGYALGLGKKVAVTRSTSCGGKAGKTTPPPSWGEAWFPFHAPEAMPFCCVQCAVEIVSTKRKSPAVSEESRCESPVELAFLRSMRKHDDLIVFCPNVPVMDGRYRIDFADARRKIGIEIDGHQYHSDKETFAKDRVRQRDLEKDGWRIVRYSGQEVHRDADSCVADLRTWLAAVA